MAQTNYSYDGLALFTTSGFLGTSVIGSTGHDDTNYGSGNNVRGNLTSVSQMLSPGTFITTKTNYYNILGELVQTTDARGNSTYIDYTDKWASGTGSCVPGATNAYPTTTKLPTTVTNTNVTIYSGCDGTVYSTQDQNDLNAGRPGTVYTYDGLQRVTNVSYPDGGSTQTSYGGTATPQVITTTTAVASGTSIISATTLDGLGRTSQTALTSDPDGTTYTAATYDNLGRAYQVYNPTRCSIPTSNCGETTWGVTTTFYDALSRPCLVVPPDGTLPGSSPCGSQPSNTVLTTYSGNVTTVTDQAGKARKSTTDALGRLTQVFEDPGSSPHMNYETDYGYDALDNLLCVAQKGTNTGTFGTCSSIPASWRPRLFAYDALSRLTSANNPESGTATYLYDSNGNLLQKTSPAPNQTGSTTVTLSYCYDVLNRVTGKAYTAQTCSNGLLPSPLVSYSYDQSTSNGLTVTNGLGRRTGMTDQAGNEAWSYDSMGRPLTDQRTTNSITKTTTYTYNLDGSLNVLTYPAPATSITYTQGGAGRPLSGANSSFGMAYSAHYAPSGALCSVDSAWGQPFRHDYTFNNRLQPAGIQAWDINSMPAHNPCTIVPAGNGDGLDLTYSYADASGHNNGNVQQIANNLDEHRTQLFTYDSLNRLATANTLSTNQPMWPGDTNALVQCWAEGYSYDAWGNLTAIAPSSSSSYAGCTQESGFSMLATTRNQLQDTNNDFVYDSAGNLIQPGPTGVTYTFDAENHLTSAAGMVYLYDGDGKRVGKAPSRTPTQPNFLYWYGGGSNVLQQTDGAGNFLYRELYFNGMLFDRQESDNWEDHFFADALGNTRSVYGDGDPDGGNSDYYPFGGERPINGTGVGVSFKFTAKERDSESSLDNFLARFNSSQFGRFLSADPENAGSDPGDPQSWNAYSYVEGDPLNMIDPDGLAPQQQCTVDGGSVPCSMALDLIPQGAGSLCPGDCSHWKFVPGNGFDTLLNTAPLGSPDNPRIDPDCSTTNCVLVSPYYPLWSRRVDSQGLCSGALCLSALRTVSDFSAGAGDCLTGRCIPFVHNSLTQWGRGSADAVVNKNSWSYAGGEVTGGAVGSALLSAGGATIAAIADGKNGAFFGRGLNTVFNSSNTVRFGWGWKGSATAGRNVIRLGIGAARGTSWYSHIIFWSRWI